MKKTKQVTAVPTDDDLLAEANRLHRLGVIFNGIWKGCRVTYVPSNRTTIKVSSSDEFTPETTETTKTDDAAYCMVRDERNGSWWKRIGWDAKNKATITKS